MTRAKRYLGTGLTLLGGALIAALAVAAEPKTQLTNPMPVDIKASFASIMARIGRMNPRWRGAS